MCPLTGDDEEENLASETLGESVVDGPACQVGELKCVGVGLRLIGHEVLDMKRESGCKMRSSTYLSGEPRVSRQTIDWKTTNRTEPN